MTDEGEECCSLTFEDLQVLRKEIDKKKSCFNDGLRARYAEIKKKTESAPLSKLYGIKCIELEQSFAHCHLRAANKLTNWNGTMHGGAIATIIDQSIGSALQTLIDYKKQPITTSHLSVNFLNPVRPGKIVCTKAVIPAGEKPIFLDVGKGNKKLIHGYAIVIAKPERIEVARGDAWYVVFGERITEQSKNEA